jgi:uncharacterized protein involved in exopolysaccharide biosynthesis
MADSNRTGRTVVPGAVITGNTIVPGQTAPHHQGAGLDQMLEVVADGPNPGAPQSFLLVISGSDPGRLLVLDRPEMVIGRSKYADIKVSERAMSQQHAKLVRAGDHHRLYDLGSTNGTFVNDQRIEQADLKVGDVIRTGETVFTYMSSAGGDQNDKTLALPTARTAPPATRPPTMATGVPATRARQVPAVRTGAMPQVLEAPNYATDEGDAITLILRLLRFFKRYWLSFIILTLIGATAGVASYRFRRPPAVATFEIDLVPKPSDNPVERQHRMNLEFFRSATQNFVRPQLIADTLAELGETDLTPQRIRSIQRRLQLKRSRGSQTMYAGSYEAPTADEAMEFLRVHLKLFLEQEVEKALQVLIVEVDTLEKNLAQAEEELNATEQAILAFKEEHSEGLPDQAQQFYQELFELDARSAELASDVARAAAEVDLSKRRLKSESPLIESRIQMARPYEDAIAEVKRDLAAAKAAGKGNQHPDVIELKQQLKRLEDLRDDVIQRGTSAKVVHNKNPVYEGARRTLQDANAAFKIARSELGRLGADKKRIEKIVGELPRLQQEYAELTRNYDSTKVVHNNLYEKLNSSKIQLDMERAAASARFDVITPPNVEKVSAVRTMIKRGFIAGFLGFMFAAGLGLIRDLRRLLAERARMEAQRS